MENSVNNCVRRRVFSRTKPEEEAQEESSWMIYFEDLDHHYDEDMSHYYDNDSSMISDAASPIHTTKINNVVPRKSNNINTNPKKRRIIHQHKEEEEEEEDTASSPSNKTKGLSVLDHVAEANKRCRKSVEKITSEERGCTKETLSKKNEDFLSAELKKRGLCVVPLSMLSNLIA